MAVANLLGRSVPIVQADSFTSDINQDLTPAETFQLGSRCLPRLFSGLWQLSSPAWGAASITKILQQFTQYTQNGLTAFDMADHYGDAEIIFVRLSFSIFRLLEKLMIF
jgi:predicted oxidoreductase